MALPVMLRAYELRAKIGAGWLFGGGIGRLAPGFFWPKLPALVRPRRNGLVPRRYGQFGQRMAVHLRTSPAWPTQQSRHFSRMTCNSEPGSWPAARSVAVDIERGSAPSVMPSWQSINCEVIEVGVLAAIESGSFPRGTIGLERGGWRPPCFIIDGVLWFWSAPSATCGDHKLE